MSERSPRSTRELSSSDPRDGIDFREHPEAYRIGRGESGVFHCEPYRSELLPHWRFATPEVARESAETLFSMFETYRDNGDFPGADMARKYLQMGWTRSRRYANHRSGRKYDPETGEPLPRDEDSVKAECARIFREFYDRARTDEIYLAMKNRHQRLEREQAD